MDNFYEPLNFTTDTPIRREKEEERVYNTVTYIEQNKWLINLYFWVQELMNGVIYVIPFIILICLSNIYMKMYDVTYIDIDNELVIGIYATIIFIIIILLKGVIDFHHYMKV